VRRVTLPAFLLLWLALGGAHAQTRVLAAETNKAAQDLSALIGSSVPPRAPFSIPDNPTAEACNVNIHDGKFARAVLPYADYAKEIHPALDAMTLEHEHALRTYHIPFKTFWTLTGLSVLFPNAAPIEECCVSCPMICGAPVEFTKNATNPQLATFTIRLTLPQPAPYYIELKEKNAIYEAGAAIPVMAQGVAYIDAAAIAFFFKPDFSRSGYNLFWLVYRNVGTDLMVFANPIGCSSITRTWASIRRQKLNVATPPDIDFLIDTK